jgi:hypothetical protein
MMQSINRAVLRKALYRASLLRLVIVGASAFVLLFVAALGLPATAPEWQRILLFIGGTHVVLGITTIGMCRRMVKCPFCRKSLWPVCCNDQKPGSIKVRDDVHCCPHCKVSITD